MLHYCVLFIYILFCYFVQWPTNTRLIDNLSHSSYMFRHYFVILRELVISTLPSYTSMTFAGPCIVIYFYSKTNQKYNISNLFYFGTTLCMFWTVSPSVVRSLRLYIQHQVYVIQVLWLLASGNEMGHLVSASKQTTVSVWRIFDAVCTVLDSWWWTEKPSKTCRVFRLVIPCIFVYVLQ
jgi:hypothetical protein